MKRFVLNLVVALLACTPIFIYYIVADPYSVIWRKDLNTCPNVAVRGLLALDLHSNLHYDSFIFGSSRSENYRIDDWKTHIDDTAVACHSQQSGDNVYGTLARLKYLNNRYGHIENALFIMDHDYLSGNGLKDGYQFRNHWKVTGRKDLLPFHKEFFSAFFEVDKQLVYLGLKEKPFRFPSTYVSEYDERQSYGNDSMLNNGYFEEYNERYVLQREEYYWFYDRDTTIQEVHDQVIHDAQLSALHEIKGILDNNHTSYRIIIGPMYDLKKFNPIDLRILQDIFGEEYVFDFSGINEYTKDQSNYYEASHYRPHVCREIMNRIYN